MSEYNYNDLTNDGRLKIGGVVITPRVLEALEGLQLREGIDQGIDAAVEMICHLLDDLTMIPPHDLTAYRRHMEKMLGCRLILNTFRDMKPDEGVSA